MEREGGTPRGLRIGELAALAGTTARAIRHYHALGLLAEPARDASGYRRYGPEHLVTLTRIRRLRSLGLPLARIDAAFGAEGHDPDDLAAALRGLADDLSRQIEELEARRNAVRALASPDALAAPTETWRTALQEHGLLDERAALPAGERQAVDLLDALHPDGVAGVVAGAASVLSDPSLRARLASLLARFGALPADAGDDEVERLAAELAAALPRPATVPPAIDLAAMDRLVGDRLPPAQRRCMHAVRLLLERPGP